MSSVQVTTTSDLPLGSMKSFRAGDSLVLVAHCDDGFYAVSDICTHMGGDLSQGQLDACVVTCPLHGSRFDVRNGANLSGPRSSTMKPHDLRSYPVTLDGEAVKIEV